MKRAFLLLGLVPFLASSAVSAPVPQVPTIEVGDHLFLPGETKTIALYAGGDIAVQGLNLYVQIGDGGAINGGVDTKPKLTSIDVIGPDRTGIGPATIFNGNNTSQTNTFTDDLLWAVSVTTNTGSVTASDTRTLAFLTIDTTGTMPGDVYPLLLSGTAKGIFGAAGADTDFATMGAVITNGTITIVPEPSSITLLLLALGTVALAGLRRRRQQAVSA